MVPGTSRESPCCQRSRIMAFSASVKRVLLRYFFICNILHPCRSRRRPADPGWVSRGQARARLRFWRSQRSGRAKPSPVKRDSFYCPTSPGIPPRFHTFPGEGDWQKQLHWPSSHHNHATSHQYANTRKLYHRIGCQRRIVAGLQLLWPITANIPMSPEALLRSNAFQAAHAPDRYPRSVRTQDSPRRILWLRHNP